MRGGPRRLGVAAACALLLALGGCTDSPDVASGDGQGFVAGDGSVQVVDAADRLPAPELSGVTLDGDELSLADFDGDVVVLNLWASWCGPCRGEAPALQQVSEDFAQQGVQFVGINSRDHEADALAFERTFGITYPSLVDTDGQLQLGFHDTVPPTSIPWTLIIDREGMIAARVLGPTTFSQLTDLVDQVAAEN